MWPCPSICVLRVYVAVCGRGCGPTGEVENMCGEVAVGSIIFQRAIISGAATRLVVITTVLSQYFFLDHVLWKSFVVGHLASSRGEAAPHESHGFMNPRSRPERCVEYRN